MFLIFNFWSWIFKKSSKFWAASCKTESNLLLVRFTVCIESWLSIGWRTLIWWKNPPKCSSILVNDGIFYMQAAIQRTIYASPAFMEYGLAKKIAAWAHANREPNKQEDWIQFCMKRLRTLKSFKIFKSEIKKLKTNSGGLCAFKGLFNDTTLMQIQSGRTVPLISNRISVKVSGGGDICY
jgi:hypothetical protein